MITPAAYAAGMTKREKNETANLKKKLYKTCKSAQNEKNTFANWGVSGTSNSKIHYAAGLTKREKIETANLKEKRYKMTSNDHFETLDVITSRAVI